MRRRRPALLDRIVEGDLPVHLLVAVEEQEQIRDKFREPHWR